MRTSCAFSGLGILMHKPAVWVRELGGKKRRRRGVDTRNALFVTVLVKWWNWQYMMWEMSDVYEMWEQHVLSPACVLHSIRRKKWVDFWTIVRLGGEGEGGGGLWGGVWGGGVSAHWKPFYLNADFRQIFFFHPYMVNISTVQTLWNIFCPLILLEPACFKYQHFSLLSQSQLDSRHRWMSTRGRLSLLAVPYPGWLKFAWERESESESERERNSLSSKCDSCNF